MASGDIAVNLIGQNGLSPVVGQSIQSFNALNMAIDRHISRVHGQNRAQHAFNQMIGESITEQSRGIQVTGKQQMAINQLIFAVDDAATSYGNGGLAGAVRGAANNLTMAASMMGPWGAAIGVGVMAATQLGLALTKTGDDAQKSTELLEGFKKEVEAIDKAAAAIRNRQSVVDPNQFGATEAGVKIGELGDQSKRIDEERMFLHNRIPDLERQAEEFATSRTTDKTNVMGGLSDADKSEFYRQKAEIERLREREAELGREQDLIIKDKRRLERAMPDLQQREADAFGAQQQQADIRAERQARADRESGRVMAQEFQSEMQKSSNDPRQQMQGKRSDILSGFQRNIDQIDSLGNVDPAIRAQMRAAAEQTAVNQLTSLERGRLGTSAKGPATLRAGEADTLRFLNQARAGASAKTAEEKELAKLNATSREMLTAFRDSVKAQREQPVVLVDF